MSHATDTLESAIGDALFLGQPFPMITQWTVHLFTGVPNDAGTGGTEVPAGANGYQPVRHDPGPMNWVKNASQDASGNTIYQNASTVQFTTAVSAWGWINGFGLTNQNDERLYVAPLAQSRQVNAGDRVVFLPGELQFLIG
ncbi:MAG: hypothetical protein KDJ28_01500 [Candidatus Competibacteraceae bacterium]|nr:hypothetical protein [Candidatus Competibacteraceae bacterium]